MLKIEIKKFKTKTKKKRITYVQNTFTKKNQFLKKKKFPKNRTFKQTIFESRKEKKIYFNIIRFMGKIVSLCCLCVCV